LLDADGPVTRGTSTTRSAFAIVAPTKANAPAAAIATTTAIIRLPRRRFLAT